MKKDKTGRKIVVRIIILLLMACFFLYAAWFWGNRGDWAHFSICLVSYLIFAIWFSIAVICGKLDKRFEQLENLLKDQYKNKKEKTPDKSVEV